MPKLKQKITSLLCSIPFVITLLFSIIVACALGTFIPQGLPPSHYIQKYGTYNANLLSFFRLNDMYHSGWFITILALLWLSLFTCTLRQLKSWKKSYASIIVHLGLLVILIGSLITGIFG